LRRVVGGVGSGELRGEGAEEGYGDVEGEDIRVERGSGERLGRGVVGVVQYIGVGCV
jgi:hypothetical protein